MKTAILRDSNPESSFKWEVACKKKNMEYQVIDMLCSNWLENLVLYNPDFCLSRPPGDIQQNKQVFDQRLYFLEQHTPYTVFPGYHETVIYENKAALADFLLVNRIPHPKTFVSYDKHEAADFINRTKYPIIAKTLIGAAGAGIKTLKSKREAEGYVTKAFKEGISRRYGPNRKTGSPGKWLFKAVSSPRYLFKKLKEYRALADDVQKGVVLFQEYIPHEYEWRCVKIGDSFFAYKKLKLGDQASGSKQFEYGAPPPALLDFTRSLCDRFHFNFMAVDIFRNETGIYVNELQTIFGHVNAYICMVDGRPGRYRYVNNQWAFEAGDFNSNESFDLRLEVAVELFKKSKK